MLIQDNFFNLAPTLLERCQIIKYSRCNQTVPLLTEVLMCNFFLVFVSTIDGQQSNPVCCCTDSLTCSTYIVLLISSLSEIVNVMCLVILAGVCLFVYVCSLGAITIAQCAQ